MCFDVAPLLVYDAAQLALHCLERIVNGFGQRRMRAVIHLLFSGNQFVPWSHRHIDADVIRISLLMGVVSLLDRYVAAVDVVAKISQVALHIQKRDCRSGQIFPDPGTRA